MSSARLRLIAAAALFLGWLGWLGFAVSRSGLVQIVSRAQLTAATHLVVAKITIGPEKDDKQQDVIHVDVEQGLQGSLRPGRIEVTNIRGAVTPVPVNGRRTVQDGIYLLALQEMPGRKFRIAGLPRSPGYDAAQPEQPVIYVWNADVEKQLPK